MNYYYAHTNHKGDLDALRRGVAYIKNSKDEVRLLVNDFRAGLVAKELGVSSATTLETIHDIDLMLELHDVIIIDSTEILPKNFQEICSHFQVTLITFDSQKQPLYSEKIIDISKTENMIVDDYYKIQRNKVKRRVYFLGDSDSEKSIVKNGHYFQDKRGDLLLGHYFFVNYEKEIEGYFDTLFESEEYREVVTTSSQVVTTSLQCALEAKSSGADVVFINQKNIETNSLQLLTNLNINIIDNYYKCS